MQQYAGEEANDKHGIFAAGLLRTQVRDYQEDNQKDKGEMQANRDSEKAESLQRSCRAAAFIGRSCKLHTSTITEPPES